MTLDELKEIIKERELENVIVFENPSYANAVVGISHDDRIIYDYDQMIECLVQEDGMTVDDAIDFINYNTIRSMPYYPDGPIILMALE